jgi:hypothetical protein
VIIPWPKHKLEGNIQIDKKKTQLCELGSSGSIAKFAIMETKIRLKK